MAGIRDLISFDRMSDFWGILRELDPGAVERDANRSIRLVVCGQVGVGKRRLAAELTGGDLGSSVIDVYDMPTDVPIALPEADAYIYVTSALVRNPPVESAHLRQLSHRSAPVLVVLTDATDADNRGLIDRLAAAGGLDPTHVVALSVDHSDDVFAKLVPTLLRSTPSIALPLGRQLPALRRQAANRLVEETSQVNAEFAALSGLPALIPIVGGFAAAGADMIVLTKNQVMLILKLAITHGRSVDNRLQVITELVPIVGAGFLWRTIARSLVALVPGPLTIAPKVAVAYVGTYVVGKAAQHYYRVGKRPSVETLEHFQREALEQLRSVLPNLSQLGRRISRP